MGYAGKVFREHASGTRIARGPISKAGNAHVRRIAIEAVWIYRDRPNLGATRMMRQSGPSKAFKNVAWRAQHRLHARYRAPMVNGKPNRRSSQRSGASCWALSARPAASSSAVDPRRYAGLPARLPVGNSCTRARHKRSAAGMARGKGESSCDLCDRPSLARPAPLVRGSSRRIATMMAGLAPDRRISE